MLQARLKKKEDKKTASTLKKKEKDVKKNPRFTKLD